MQVLEWGVQPIDPALTLVEVLVRIRQRVEADRVSFDAVPPFGTRNVLHKVDPGVSLRDRFVLVAVPFRNGKRALLGRDGL